MAQTNFTKLRDSSQPQQSRVQDNIAQTVQPTVQAVAKTPIGGAPPPAWLRPSKYSQDFADSSSTLQTAFHKDALGYTWLRLYAKTAGGVAVASEVFVLDSAYRPLTEVRLVAFNSATGAINPLSVDATGSVKTLAAVAAGESIVGYVPFLAGA